MTLEPPRRTGVGAPGSTAGIAVLAGLVAAVLVAAVIDPFGPSLHDPDAAASVLYFDRIVSGQRLEAFVPTTPKPLLTLLYGASWALTGDWRTLGLWTLIAFAVAVTASTALLLRIGGRPAAAFAAVALVASPTVAVEIAGANSLVWGLAGWAVAGLAIAGGPRRAWIAGLALAAAATFRTETLVVVALATGGVALLAFRPALADAVGGGGGLRPPGTSPARRWGGLLLGWLAVPIAGLHDQLLTGDPLSWLRVPAGYTAITTPDLRPTPPLDFAADVVARYAGEPLLVGLGAIGIAWLIGRRQIALATGVLGLTAGIAALIGFVAWRGVFVTTRYFEQVDLGLIGAAAIGVGAIATTLNGRLGGRGGPLPLHPPDRWREALGVLAAVVLAIVVTAPTAFFDGGLATRLRTVRSASDHVADALPTLRAALDADDSPVPAAVAGPAGLAVVDPARATILVPRALWTRLALELDVPLTRLADSWLAFRDAGPLAVVRPGQTIYHDRSADAPPALYEPLELDADLVAGAIRLVLVRIDPLAGTWILAVEATP